MRMYDIIDKKRLGGKLTKEEIAFFVDGYTGGSIPDYQASALLMAIAINGMDVEETTELTLLMAKSGDMLDLSEIKGVNVDKHSSGGVGDKTTLIIAPMVATLGIPVAKMSGRGLGHTGGTIDKLEAIPGFNTALSKETFFNNVNTIGVAVAGQTANLAPADKKLYALRDVTATVSSIPLIAASIMSKKLAAGADVIVLDVKAGSGAFMKTVDSARELARRMVDIGNNAGRKTFAVITDMNDPLGTAVGNALEVIEAVEALRGKGDEKLMEVVYTLASYMVFGAGKAASVEEARKMLEETITSGKALERFAQFVKAQGGDDAVVYDTSLFKLGSIVTDVPALEDGFVSGIRADEVGIASLILGAGREKKEDVIDPGVGIIVKKKTGDAVKKGETIATLYANDPAKVKAATERLYGAYTFSKSHIDAPKMIYDIVE
ncbi:MAG: pyrimidine-nucleoside phosphorylase [Lachnospiraceae bacterium]|nr:pyrimidine-nucleoside phosphorylase [Lachnospiraceae bacterium]